MSIETYKWSGMHLAVGFCESVQYALTGTQLKIPAKNQIIPFTTNRLASDTRMRRGGSYPGDNKPHGELEGNAHLADRKNSLVLEYDRRFYEREADVVGHDYTAILQVSFCLTSIPEILGTYCSTINTASGQLLYEFRMRRELTLSIFSMPSGAAMNMACLPLPAFASVPCQDLSA
jgi:hypothetical protein